MPRRTKLTRVKMRVQDAVFVLVALVLSGSAVRVGAQVHTSLEERFFRIDWQIERAEARPPAMVGIVTNHYLYAVERVRLQARVLDQAGQLTHEALGVINEIPAGGRSTFRLELPATGARYIVTVHSFDFGAPQSP